MNKPEHNQTITRLSKSNWVFLAAMAGLMAGFAAHTPVFAQEKQNPPIFENVRLAPDFRPDPLEIRGVSGGSESARKVATRAETPTGPCVGFVDQQPDHRLVLTSFFDYLKIEVESADDTTIVVRGPGGTWCNDDTNGKNPSIAGQWQEGVYSVWIGSYREDVFSPYVIRLTQVR